MNIKDIGGVTLLHYKMDSEIANIRIVVNAGSTIEDRPKGIAHFLEHMFFKGTKKKNYKQVNRIMSSLGDVNAYTSFDKTVFYLSTLSSRFSEAAEIMAELFCQPAFRKEEFEKERGVIIEEIQSGLDKPSSYFWHCVCEAHAGNIYAPVCGNRKAIKKMSIADIKKYRENYYVADDIAVVVVGNVSTKNAERFALMIRSGVIEAEWEIMDMREWNWGHREFHHKSKQAHLMVTFNGMNQSDAIDTNYAWYLLLNGLGGGMHSLLFNRIREELGLCYSVHAYSHIDSTMIYVMLDEKNINTVVDEILRTIDKIKRNGLDKKLFETSRNNMLFNVASRFQTPRGIATCADFYFQMGRRYIDCKTMMKQVKKLTNADVIECARRLFDGNSMIASMTNE